MKLKVLFAAALLCLALPAAADYEVVQEAYEVALSDMRLPRAEGGTIAFKECATCEYRRVRVAADTTYRINGKPLTLAKFRATLEGVADRENQPVTVLRHVERNQVTDVSVYLRG